MYIKSHQLSNGSPGKPSCRRDPSSPKVGRHPAPQFFAMIFALILTLLPTISAVKLSVLGWVKLCEESLAIVEGRNVARCQLLHRGLSGKAVPAKLQTPTL